MNRSEDIDYVQGRVAYCYSNNHMMIPTQFWKSFNEMAKPLDFLKSHGGSSTKAQSINESIYNALQGKAEWIFLMDVDQLFPVHTITRLLSSAKKLDAKIISVLYHRGIPPYPPVAGWSKKNKETGEDDPIGYDGNDWREQYSFPDSGVVEVGWCGAGGLLVHRDVFQKLVGPDWFYDTFEKGKLYRKIGHDINFCSDARKAGYKIYVDTAVQSAHGKMFYFNTAWVKTYNRVHFSRELEKTKHETTLEKDYWDTLHQVESIHDCNFRNETLRRTYDQIIAMVPEGSLVADVGCGRGFLMKELRDKKKATCVGYDISDEAIIDVHRNKFEGHVVDVRNFSLNGEAGKFDVVIASHLIEHIYKDSAFVDLLKSMTKKGGKVILATPSDPEIQNHTEHVRGYTQDELLEFMTLHFNEVQLHKNKRDFIAVGVLADPIDMGTVSSKPVQLSVG